MDMQLIEVAVVLIAVFFVLSLMASAIVEIGSFLFQKRSKDLRIVLDRMLEPTGKKEPVLKLWDTTVLQALIIASNQKRGVAQDWRTSKPSYISARSFADAVLEGLASVRKSGETVDQVIKRLPASPLKNRMIELRKECNDDLVVFRSGLEGWFDDIMDRLAGAYKRWTQWILLSVGLLLAVAFNISAVRLVDSLWNDAALRAAAADSAVAIANNAVENQDTECLPTVAPPTSVTPAASATPVPLEQCIAEKVEGAIGQVGALEVPMGWGSGFDGYEWYWTALGWIPMGLATMIGAPFWFDLLVRLAGIRESRGKPSRVPDDPASATAQVSKGNGSSLRVRPAWDELFPPSGEGPDSPGAAL